MGTNNSVSQLVFASFLQENRKYAVNGLLNYETKRSKSTNKRYTEIDLYEYNKEKEKLNQENSSGEVTPDDLHLDPDLIPF